MSGPLVERLLKISLPVLMTSVEEISHTSITRYFLSSFTETDYYSCAEMILGKPFELIYHQDIENLGVKIGYLPILADFLLKQIAKSPHAVHAIIQDVEEQFVTFNKIIYDNKKSFSLISGSF